MKIVAITACPSGVAHTYMAAARLESVAKQMGHTIKVEKQGAKGIENKLSKTEIDEADIVIFAVETKVKEEERFSDKKVYKCSVTAPIKDAKSVIETASSEQENKVSLVSELKNHLLTGVSYMLPLALGASFVMGLAQTVARIYGIEDIGNIKYSINGIIGFIHTLNSLGEMSLGLMLPVLAGFIAYSIAEKNGLITGFVGGFLAKELGSGFFGVLAVGIIAGYLTKFLSNKIEFKGSLSGLNSDFISMFSILLILLVVVYIINFPFAWFNHKLVYFFMNMTTAEAVTLAFIIGALLGIDLGGPINKVILVIAIGIMESKIYVPNTAVMIAIVIPAIGYGIFSILAKKSLPEKYIKDGKESLKMGLIGISEGAISFTQKNTKYLIPINMVGCGIGAAIAVGFGAINITTIAGCYGWLLVENWPVYILGVGIGAFVIAIGAMFCISSFKED